MKSFTGSSRRIKNLAEIKVDMMIRIYIRMILIDRLARAEIWANKYSLEFKFA